ncbi:epimerase [Salmonella enterica subsp. enterica]|uniref:Epimerase n=1 Tax=Salmonella enterica I TaxID=59201 RepID=A0A3S4HTM4_SALET|nr:epimerase [Salmonella enterica subsp. enterica]
MDGGASLREGGRTLASRFRLKGDIHLHHTLSWLGQQTVPVIGGEMPVIRGD